MAIKDSRPVDVARTYHLKEKFLRSPSLLYLLHTADTNGVAVELGRTEKGLDLTLRGESKAVVKTANKAAPLPIFPKWTDGVEGDAAEGTDKPHTVRIQGAIALERHASGIIGAYGQDELIEACASNGVRLKLEGNPDPGFCNYAMTLEGGLDDARKVLGHFYYAQLRDLSPIQETPAVTQPKPALALTGQAEPVRDSFKSWKAILLASDGWQKASTSKDGQLQQLQHEAQVLLDKAERLMSSKTWVERDPEGVSTLRNLLTEELPRILTNTSVARSLLEVAPEQTREEQGQWLANEVGTALRSMEREVDSLVTKAMSTAIFDIYAPGETLSSAASPYSTR